jgi:hypothetical protein
MTRPSLYRPLPPRYTCRMTAPSHQALYRSLPLVLGGLLGSLLLLVAGIAGVLPIAAREQRLALALGMLGGFVLIFALCALASLRRHRWTIDGNAVLIEERPLVPMIGPRRVRRVPFGDVASLSNVSEGGNALLALTTSDGEHFVLPPVRTRGTGAAAKPDQEGLASFAALLQAAMTAAGAVAPPVTDGLGFWNRPSGLALLTAVFLASLAVAAVILWGLWEGEIRRARTHEAAAFLVALPIALGWWLRRCWQRRRGVLRAMQARPL